MDRSQTNPNGVEIDHIKQNIELSGKIPMIKDIQLFYRNFIKEQNLQDKNQFKDEIDLVQR